jgi:hypothetical protein
LRGAKILDLKYKARRTQKKMHVFHNIVFTSSLKKSEKWLEGPKIGTFGERKEKLRITSY